jgi:hypothetical protein
MKDGKGDAAALGSLELKCDQRRSHQLFDFVFKETVGCAENQEHLH